jgi:predicted enzyme related to lactoylglutathione lyase
MDEVKAVKMGANVVISGLDRAAVEAAARALAAKGGKMVSAVEKLGAKWVVTCEDPADRTRECQVIKVGMQSMVKGPTEAAVKAKVLELTSHGAHLVSAPSEATGGGWVAVCDDSEQIHKW